VSDTRKTDHHFDFDRHSPDYRFHYEEITEQLQQKCPIAWSDTYEGHWVASSSHAVFELARCPHISNDHDVKRERRGYQGITIPTGTSRSEAACWRWMLPNIVGTELL